MTAPPLRQQDLIPEMVRRVPYTAQVATAATTATTLVTADVQYITRGRVLVCERGGAAATFRIALRPLGATLANAHYIVYDAPLVAYENDHTIELELAPTDVITVYASTANLSFTFNGYKEPYDTL